MWSSTRPCFIIILNLFIFLVHAQKCVPRYFESGSFVCVCNSTYCDSEPREVPKKGQYRIYDSGKDRNRLSAINRNFVKNAYVENDPSAVLITINPEQQFQRMHGFGGAFTDSAGINIQKLSPKAQNRIIEAYFGGNGNRYTLGRVPIGGTDFSTRPYTYDDVAGDVGLKHWRLTTDDFMYKIPYMKKARILSPGLKFVSAAWSAPPWMKTNGNITGYGFLEEKYFQVYANYLTNFLTEYKKLGLEIWAITSGNEPSNVMTTMIKFNSMGWTQQTVGKFIAENLGPTISTSDSNDTLILIIDDQRFSLPGVVTGIFENLEAKNYTAGIAVHWYADEFIITDLIDVTHDLYPDKFILVTEGCVGGFLFTSTPAVILGSWTRAQAYIEDLMENFKHWITGYVDWNLVLDKTGGPSWVQNYVDAPIIVNPENDEFFKQPTYYALAHFSKFITPGSIRIGTTESCCIDSLAFLTPDDETVIILYNSDQVSRAVEVKDPQQGNIYTNISASSIQTIIYKR